MMTSGQIWVTRRLDDIIETVEEAAGDIDTADYPNFQSWMMDVFDSALNRLHDESYQSESNFLDKYSGILSAMEDMFKDQLEDFYLSEKDNDVINESSLVLISVILVGLISACLQSPKSVSFTCPSLSIKILSGFKSLWI